MASDKKVAEGMEALRQGEKWLKTSLFKWQPDYDNAAIEFNKAATCFKTARSMNQSKDALLKAADCYNKNRSFFSAAKNYEQAAMISKDMNDFEGAAQFIERAAFMFREHGTPDSAAICLDKGARIIESKLPGKSVDFYLKAADVAMIEDRSLQAADYCGKAARLLLKMNRLDEGVEAAKRQMHYYLEAEHTQNAGRLVVCLVIIHLARDDYVAANKAYKDGKCYVEADEMYSLETLLEGYDEADWEKVAEGLKSPFIMNMDVAYSRLAAQLLKSSQSQTSRPKTLEVGDDQNAEEEDYGSALL